MKKYRILALVFAALTGVCVFFVLRSLQTPADTNEVSVVVAAKAVPKNTALTADMLQLKKLPSEAVLPDAARNVGDVVGMLTGGALETGEPILVSKLIRAGTASQGFSYSLPDGKRAVTIPVDSTSGVAGFIRPGDRVDVLAILTLQKKNSPDRAATSLTLLQDRKVLAVGSSTEGNDSVGGYDTVTLEVTPDEALKLNLAANSGKLRLVLRYPLDSAPASANPKTEDDLN